VIADILAGTPEVWMVVPEGNGKTTLMALAALYHGDYTPSAAVLMAASSRDQCELLHSQAAGFVHRTPAMRKRFKVFDGYRRIRCLRTGGRIQVFAADDRTGDGVIPTLALVDELHRHKDLRLYRTWRGKLDKRGGQLVAISTAGEPGTEFEEIRARARTEAPDLDITGAHVRAASSEMVLHDWSVPADEDVEDMKAVAEANPFSGVTEESLTRKRSSPTMTLAHWRRFVCNQAVRQEGTAVTEAEWATAGVDDEIPADAGVTIGIDLGWKWDTTALVPLWMPDRETRLLGDPGVLEPPRDGTSLHPREVQQALRGLAEEFTVDLVVMDPEAGGEQLAAWIEDELGLRVATHSQKPAPMALAFERFMEALQQGWLHHTKSPVLARHVLNAVAKQLPDGRARFDRLSQSRAATRQDQRVIDALIAAAMAHSVGVAEFDRPAPRRGFAFL
jgi:phage terminase large subunit-like protein